MARMVMMSRRFKRISEVGTPKTPSLHIFPPRLHQKYAQPIWLMKSYTPRHFSSFTSVTSMPKGRNQKKSLSMELKEFYRLFSIAIEMVTNVRKVATKVLCFQPPPPINRLWPHLGKVDWVEDSDAEDEKDLQQPQKHPATPNPSQVITWAVTLWWFFSGKPKWLLPFLSTPAVSSPLSVSKLLLETKALIPNHTITGLNTFRCAVGRIWWAFTISVSRIIRSVNPLYFFFNQSYIK